MRSKLFFVGIDGGGTKCRARLEDADGTLLGEGVSGPANIMRNCDIAIQSIETAVEHAIAQSGIAIQKAQCVIGAGLAGANVPLAAKAFSAWQHPFNQVFLLSDLHAACLGAHEGQSGAAIIIGTGSSGTCWHQGQFTDVGGHGFPIGDIASGAWLGLKAVQHTLLVMDKLLPADALSQAICEALQVSSTEGVVTACAQFNTNHYATLVEVMVPLREQGDVKTVQLFHEGATYIGAMAERLTSGNALPLAFIGGLSAIYATELSCDASARVVPCVESPQQGALRFAKRELSLVTGVK